MWWLSWLAGGITERDQTNNHSSKVWFHLSKWFQRRRFFIAFSLRYYVKISSAVAAILVGGRGHQIQFWKRTNPPQFGINWLCHFGGDFFQKAPPFSLNNGTGWLIKTLDIILKGDQPRTIPLKLGWNGFRGED